MANIAWGLAKMGLLHEELLQAGKGKVGEKYFFLGDPWLAGGNSIFLFSSPFGEVFEFD